MFAPEFTYRQVRTIAGRGAGAGQFTSTLRGIAVDGRGAVCAAGDSEVKLFDPLGQLVRRWPTARPGLSVAIAPDGTVWVGETGQIEVFSPTGKPLTAWRDENLFGRVTSIGFSAGSAFAGDAGARAIRHLDPSGKFRNNIGMNNPTSGLLIPNGVVDFSVDAAGVVYAANPGKHRVERYSSAGELLGHIGRFTGPDPAGFSGCCNPTNVAVWNGRGIVVTEKAAPRGKLYDFAGKLQAIIGGDCFDPMCRNMDIAVEPGGRVAIGDTERLHVLVFEPVPAGGAHE